MSLLYVREDDTVTCADCYSDEGPWPRLVHREIHAAVEQGTCESCGRDRLDIALDML